MCPAIAVLDLGAVFQAPSDVRPRRDPAFEALVAETSNVPPELVADILVRLATSPKMADPAWKRELLDEAFRRAGAARAAYRRTALILDQDTRPGALHGAATRASFPLEGLLVGSLS